MQRSGVRYAPAGEVSIAYESYGDGPMDIVFVPGFVSHLDLQWELPHWVATMEHLTRFARVTTFDKRGTGESERTLGFGSAGERMDDIRAVMDHAGIERASLYGASEGGPLSILFAATYPDRVERLALYGTFARILPEPGYDAPFPGEPEDFVQHVEAAWGTGEVMGMFLRHDPEQVAFCARFERSSASPKIAATVMRSNLEIDVRDALSAITVPTLVLHQDGDPMISSWHGRYLAEHISGSRLVLLDGDFHAPIETVDQPEMRAAVEEFFTGKAPTPTRTDRVLATVLFTDIVDSTSRASALGDDRWRTLLDRHDRVSAAEIERHGGVLVKSTGDGVLARFDGPGRAVACAQAVRREVAQVGLEVRAGLHTGEVELRGDDVAGIAVHLASRIASAAGAGEVLVSRTVRDLTAGSDLNLEDRGEHQLKGLDEPWQLYAAAV